MPIDTSLKFVPINIAILTISDTRAPDTDTSGALLEERINSAGHNCIEKKIIPDDVKLIRETLQILTDKEEIDCIITTGGTGLTGRDTTPEAVIEIANKILSDHKLGGTTFVVGNGGSASIASHVAVDFLKALSADSYSFNII